MRVLGACLVALLAASGAACVHASVERTGRAPLGGGSEGYAAVWDDVPSGYEEVARVTVEADGIATPERLERHLRRRASLMGCDAMTAIQVTAGESATGNCVRRLEPAPAITTDGAVIVASPPEALLDAARRAGPEGATLLQVLEQVERAPASARAWPLRWYVSNYPNSRFVSDVTKLFIEERELVHDAQLELPLSTRAAPSVH